MNKQEAIAAMQEGKKVTHLYFSDDEFVTMNGDVLIDEMGYAFDPKEFWRFRTESYWDQENATTNGRKTQVATTAHIAHTILDMMFS